MYQVVGGHIGDNIKRLQVIFAISFEELSNKKG
jgi:hypothetical protein